MRLRSFTLRIAILSTVIAGVVICAVGIAAVVWVNHLHLQRLDHEIAARTLPHLGGPGDPQHYSALETMLQYTYDSGDTPGHFILVRDAAGHVIHSSDQLPPDLPEAELTLADAPTLPRPRMQPGLSGLPPGGPKGTMPSDDMPPPPPAGPPPEQLHEPQFATLTAAGQHWRVGVMGTENTTVIVGVSLADHTAYMNRVRLAFFIILPLALLLVAAGGWLVAGRALKAVRVLTVAAETITAEGLDRRIRSANSDVEFARLIDVFNEMLERLERSFGQATRFSADAAHELKTPLTILQGQLEQSLQTAPPDSDEQRRYGELLEEVQRLKGITRKLLLLSLADAGELKVNLRQTDLSTTIEDLCDDARVLAPQLSIEAKVEPGVEVLADQDLLQQLLQNLINNAIKYNRNGGLMHVELAADEKDASVRISNTGPGIPPEDQGRIFDRFQRVDAARGREVDGVGLGLSLSLEIARAHEGALELERSDDALTTFLLRLPLAGEG